MHWFCLVLINIFRGPFLDFAFAHAVQLHDLALRTKDLRAFNQMSEMQKMITCAIKHI